MVKEIKIDNFNQITFYPLDLLDEEPPEIVVKKDVDSNFRISQIMRYNNFLMSEISKRETTIKTFKNLDWACFLIEMVLVVLEIGIASVGILYTDYISLTSSASIVFTTISTFLRGITKKFMKKLEKHQSLLVLTKNKFHQVKDKFTLALKNGDIDHEEYLSIFEEFEKYEAMRKDIINSCP